MLKDYLSRYEEFFLGFSDCIAPFNIEIDFDGISDEDTVAAGPMTVNTSTSCGKSITYNTQGSRVKCI